MDIGKVVYHKYYGEGVVEKINTGRERSVLVRFPSEELPDWFSADGKDWSGTTVLSNKPWREDSPMDIINNFVELAFVAGQIEQLKSFE